MIISSLNWTRGNSKAFVGGKSISFDGHAHDISHVTGLQSELDQIKDAASIPSFLQFSIITTFNISETLIAASGKTLYQTATVNIPNLQDYTMLYVVSSLTFSQYSGVSIIGDLRVRFPGIYYEYDNQRAQLDREYILASLLMQAKFVSTGSDTYGTVFVNPYNSDGSSNYNEITVDNRGIYTQLYQKPSSSSVQTAIKIRGSIKYYGSKYQ